MANEPNLIKSTPYLVPKVWGGDKLSRKFSSKETLGEAWLVSDLKEGHCWPSQSLEKELNHLVKIIDTGDNLSVQLHPNDEMAQQLENQKCGKNECWYILDCKEGSGVYLGIKDSVEFPEFKEAIQSGDALDQFMNFYPLKKGDFIKVPAGIVHAIGTGVTLLEVQQPSATTYRLWDWGRDREIHIDKALNVLEKTWDLNISSSSLVSDCSKKIETLDLGFKTELLDSKVRSLSLKENSSLTVVTGSVKINGHDYHQFNSFLVLNDSELELSGSNDLQFFIVE